MIEQIRQKASGLFSGGEDRGVSPVIGVILMVAITVILAAVIGAFVLGLGGDLGNGSASQVSLSLDSDGTLSHNGGDTIEEATVTGDGVAADVTLTDFAPGDEQTISLNSQGTVNVVEGDNIIATFEV